MIYITQLIYLIEGEQTAFEQFEAIAMPIISKYNGRLLLRTRTPAENVIEAGVEIPYEIHLVSFETEADFEGFKQDDERRQYLHLKERSVRSVLLIKGAQV
jgi:hypothetical protein